MSRKAYLIIFLFIAIIGISLFVVFNNTKRSENEVVVLTGHSQNGVFYAETTPEDEPNPKDFYKTNIYWDKTEGTIKQIHFYINDEITTELTSPINMNSQDMYETAYMPNPPIEGYKYELYIQWTKDNEVLEERFTLEP
ncbi:hypothetical protein SAMN05421736_11773 [Evansella caseinilytica]|uniref:Uncharacterized protein n=1 Tax=Evansella caseinilytica TaxID=1503961 RepID=A0A1H3U1M5_9BACI|nr:hypothetical protein [Evansella caseinilytica]SDZ56370.1 hypothetical protein SAMN05421736_11773 [Evansella caseinilytica]